METPKMSICLWFDSEAEDAANFYTTIFKNSKIGKVSRYEKEGFEIHRKPEGTAMAVAFTLNGMDFMGLNGGPNFKINPSISLFVTCESIDETNEIWNKVSEGGKVLMPIGTYAWSERYGWVQDKFGLTWQVSASNTEGAKQKITPSMLFTGSGFGKAEEAINYYASVFPNSSTEMMVYYPNEDSNAGKVMYSEFRLDQYDIIAMDGPGVHDFSFNEAVSFVVTCETQEKIDYYWNKLTEGGQESQCGWLKDKYGVSWQVVPSILGKLMSDPKKAPGVTKAFLQMKKFDIDKLMKA